MYVTNVKMYIGIGIISYETPIMYKIGVSLVLLALHSQNAQILGKYFIPMNAILT